MDPHIAERDASLSDSTCIFFLSRIRNSSCQKIRKLVNRKLAWSNSDCWAALIIVIISTRILKKGKLNKKASLHIVPIHM